MFAGVAAVFIAAGFVDDIPGEEIFIDREQISIELKTYHLTVLAYHGVSSWPVNRDDRLQ